MKTSRHPNTSQTERDGYAGRVRALYESGLKQSEIADAVGINRHAVGRIMKEHHIPVRPPFDIYRQGSEHGGAWRGGKRHNGRYIVAWAPDHPRAMSGYVYEHILIVEKALSRPLPPGTQVHHYGEKTDNSRLVLCPDQAYHSLIHKRQRALDACGNANWLQCRFCHKWGDPQLMRVWGKHKETTHPWCHRTRSREGAAKEMASRIVEANRQVAHVACPQSDCRAAIGKPCKSAVGNPTFPHVGRTRAAREVVG